MSSIAYREKEEHKWESTKVSKHIVVVVPKQRLNPQDDLLQARHVNADHEVVLAGEAEIVKRSKLPLDLVVQEELITLPASFTSLEAEGQVVQVVMDWQVVIPLVDVVEEDIYRHLEWDDHNIEQEVVDEILNKNTIETGHLSLIVKDPKQECQQGLVE